MNQGVEEIDPEEEEERLERVGAIDVAKASGKVCTRVPHPSVPNRRVTKVWDVSATTNAIALLADELAEMAIERVVVESTSDYWRPFLYLLEARGLKVWLVNARDVKQVPGRPKTDKIDGEALVRALLAYKRGEPRVCAMVKAPTPEEEDRRRLCRERKVLIAEQVKHVNRIKGLLFSQGISGYEPLRRNRRSRLDELLTGDGRLLPEHLNAQIRRELDRLELLLEQIKVVEVERDALLAAKETPAPAPAAILLNIKGIGPEFAAVLWSEGLFRHFDNRRQVAAYAGLAPTPWQSGAVDREQGVSKSGNPRLRTTLIQLAWLWLRHQPQSALTLWFEARAKRNGGRFKKTTIVALARKLLVALWKYVTAGVMIEGAAMKTA